MYYVYLLKSLDSDDIYLGYSQDVQRRLDEHNARGNASTKHHQWQLVYYEAYASEFDARDRERRLKQYGKSLSMLKKRLENSIRDSKGAG